MREVPELWEAGLEGETGGKRRVNVGDTEKVEKITDRRITLHESYRAKTLKTLALRPPLPLILLL